MSFNHQFSFDRNVICLYTTPLSYYKVWTCRRVLVSFTTSFLFFENLQSKVVAVVVFSIITKKNQRKNLFYGWLKFNKFFNSVWIFFTFFCKRYLLGLLKTHTYTFNPTQTMMTYLTHTNTFSFPSNKLRLMFWLTSFLYIFFNSLSKNKAK